MTCARFLWMIGCSVLFILVYGACNEHAAAQADVATWYYGWEFKIPFVPVMIVPYWSIDLFFVGSFFVCSTRPELNALGRRIVLAILAAGICFWFFPLAAGFPRPPVEGPLGALFNLLRGFDRPHNLCPSLHITLRTILAAVYARHTRGALRVAVHVWFSLVGVSTLLTWQHHVVDVAGGFVLAAACFYAIPELPGQRATRGNPRVCARYALGAVVSVAAAVAAWPWGAVLLWPAAALAATAAGYAGLGPSVFRKVGGRLSLAARIVLAPVLFGHWLSLQYYARECRPWDVAAPGVWIGRKLTDREAAQQGVTAVLDLTAECSEARPFLAVAYRNVPILDLTAPTPDQLRDAVAFITEHAARGIVYVHCKIGYSRSAAVVGAYLLASGQAATADEAVARLTAVRPSLVVRPEARAALDEFAKVG